MRELQLFFALKDCVTRWHACTRMLGGRAALSSAGIFGKSYTRLGVPIQKKMGTYIIAL